MDPELRERREDTWKALVVQGRRYSDVVSYISNKYDTPESTIESDISRIDEWLPDLDAANHKSGVSRMRELRENRQNTHQVAQKARKEGELDTELKARRQIDRGIKIDVELSQSLGLTEQEPDKQEHEVTWGEALEDAKALNEQKKAEAKEAAGDTPADEMPDSDGPADGDTSESPTDGS